MSQEHKGQKATPFGNESIEVLREATVKREQRRHSEESHFSLGSERQNRAAARSAARPDLHPSSSSLAGGVINHHGPAESITHSQCHGLNEKIETEGAEAISLRYLNSSAALESDFADDWIKRKQRRNAGNVESEKS
ncbi:hypothetical protein QN277_016881 [Acacia crassicarpa]|uniref:Uncharacterized protein n=1 Tax=Acacia crassicarpa TaxID=499986 RepID=A0AAE1MXK5_9FABA|nr:hypothetical protein QN277_016881 [Acacia crassicarpa]